MPVPNGGAFIRQGGWLSPLQLVQNGFRYLTNLGLNIVLNHEVREPQWQQGVWKWQQHGQTFRHTVLVLANGYQLRDFTQSHGIPLYPVRGQVSHLQTTSELAKLQCVLCFDGYLTPKSASGLHCLGATHVRDNADDTFSLAEHQQNIAKIQQNLTACHWTETLRESESRGKVGIRAALRDRAPLAGAAPDFARQTQDYAKLYNQLRRREAIPPAACLPNCYLLGGLGSRGLTTAPLLGELLASQLCGEPLPLGEDIRQILATNRSWLRLLLRGKTLKI